MYVNESETGLIADTLGLDIETVDISPVVDAFLARVPAAVAPPEALSRRRASRA